MSRSAAVPAPLASRLASLVQEFLCDQETLKAPVRNDALCEKARELLNVPAVQVLLAQAVR